ncbi:MAG: orotidine-5'-phosphate decarboxylase [Ignavibacteriaceae bacterium]
MKASDKLKKKNGEGKFICVGLDTDIEKIPRYLNTFDNPVVEFNRQLIESTSEYAAGYKINFAFYEKDGSRGLENLSETISIIPKDVLTIADAKRGDIGNTSQMYAKEVFDHFKFDSVTVNPYMGKDSIDPFISFSDKMIFILALTSNIGSEDFEKLKLDDGTYLFQKVISKVNQWNKFQNCGIVFGATKIEELKENIDLIGNLPLLIPGVGTQGGSFEDVVKILNLANRNNYLVNISRGIIYKSDDKDFALAAKNEIKRYNDLARSIVNN